jgi:hypothetical protein
MTQKPMLRGEVSARALRNPEGRHAAAGVKHGFSMFTKHIENMLLGKG